MGEAVTNWRLTNPNLFFDDLSLRYVSMLSAVCRIIATDVLHRSPHSNIHSMGVCTFRVAVFVLIFRRQRISE